VESLLPLYREVNTYPHLVEGAIGGNPENMSAAELHERAWELVSPLLAAVQAEAADQYRLAASRDQGLNHLEYVLPAASQGRIGTLFVPFEEQVWGRFDRSTAEVEVHGEFQSGDEDLLDAAALEALLTGGEVYVVTAEELPDRPVAAALRY
jgi:hypothetical protein